MLKLYIYVVPLINIKERLFDARPRKHTQVLVKYGVWFSLVLRIYYLKLLPAAAEIMQFCSKALYIVYKSYQFHQTNPFNQSPHAPITKATSWFQKIHFFFNRLTFKFTFSNKLEILARKVIIPLNEASGISNICHYLFSKLSSQKARLSIK